MQLEKYDIKFQHIAWAKVAHFAVITLYITYRLALCEIPEYSIDVGGGVVIRLHTCIYSTRGGAVFDSISTSDADRSVNHMILSGSEIHSLIKSCDLLIYRYR